METEVYDRDKHCGFGEAIWFDELNEVEKFLEGLNG